MDRDILSGTDVHIASSEWRFIKKTRASAKSSTKMQLPTPQIPAPNLHGLRTHCLRLVDLVDEHRHYMAGLQVKFAFGR